MEFICGLLIGVIIGAVFFKKESREKAGAALKHALDKDTN